jgi:Sec-independent protein translocase protein TatA
MVFIGLLGLVIFGPKKLVEVGQEAGKTLARLKKMSNEFQSQLGSEISATATDRPMKQVLVATRVEKSPPGTSQGGVRGRWPGRNKSTGRGQEV